MISFDNIPPDRSNDYVEWYVALSELILVTDHVVACRDPKDDRFLSLAVAGKVDCIITGDPDLLEMTTFKGIAIYRSWEFIRLVVIQCLGAQAGSHVWD